QNYLLGRLCRDAPEYIRGLRRHNLRADLRRRILFLSLRQADLFFRVGHFFDHHVHRVHVHRPRFGIDLRAQFLFRLVIIPRRHHHRIFDRRHHHFRLDVLLAEQHFDLLVEQIRHVSFLKSPLLHPVTYLRASRFPRSILCTPQFPLRPLAFSSCPICLSLEGSEVERRLRVILSFCSVPSMPALLILLPELLLTTKNFPQNSTTRFALRIASSGTSTVRASLPFSSMRTFPSANPASRPSKNFASPTGSLVEIFASRPLNRSKSAALFSARSSPGELTSRTYPGPGFLSTPPEHAPRPAAPRTFPNSTQRLPDHSRSALRSNRRQQKSGLAPTHRATRFRAKIEYIPAARQKQDTGDICGSISDYQTSGR